MMKHTTMRALAPFLLILLPAICLAQDTFDPMAKGRTLTQQFHAGETAAVAAELTPEMLQAVRGEDGLAAFRTQLGTQLGTETQVLNEEVIEASGQRVYRRTSRFERFGGQIHTMWAFDSTGRVSGFQVRPAQAPTEPAPSQYLEYQTKTPLRLPFVDEFTVFWGGRTIEQNYHSAYPDQRFAYDILIVRDGQRHEGDGTRNEDYYCFGRPLVAPAAGTIAHARDGIADNVPGQLNSEEALGNHAIIDHGNGEYSFIAHMKNGSVRVSTGDRVEAGDTLGLCGNSGRSSEPHLHYHLQTTAEFGRGDGLPAQFLDYIANDEPVACGEPVRGQRIRPRS